MVQAQYLVVGMISCWTLYIHRPYKGWEVYGQLDCTEFQTRRAAERYMEDVAEGIRRVNELDYTPRTEVVPDLREAV